MCIIFLKLCVVYIIKNVSLAENVIIAFNSILKKCHWFSYLALSFPSPFQCRKQIVNFP